jgi:hypothetical protein
MYLHHLRLLLVTKLLLQPPPHYFARNPASHAEEWGRRLKRMHEGK